MRKDLGKKSLLYPMPVLIIGTYNEKDEVDAMNAAWGGIYDYNQIFISLGAHTSTDNIRKNKEFTVSIGTKSTVEACDYVGIVPFSKDKEKVIHAGLTPFKSEHINAPLFKELPLTLECRLVSIDGNIGEGGYLVGDIINVSVDESILTDDKIDIKKLEPISFDGFNNQYVLISNTVAPAFNTKLVTRKKEEK